MIKNKYALLTIFCLFCFQSFSQKIYIHGEIVDTLSKTPLKSAVAIAVRLKDSVLFGYTRSDTYGKFEFKDLPIDTFQVIVSHPQFADASYYVIGSKENQEFNFGKIILPPKSLEVKEVVIFAYKDPVYYKGDTLVYTADSFKVKPNAVVEDLLKKLPGIKVDNKGAITANGKKVDQVLVDGDEFFGTDPTMATKNLNANAVQSVQVYEKKDVSTDENLQVMNLKLKDDAKKGYFGKTSVAGDFKKYAEAQILFNKFKGSQKISVFGFGSNTPKSGFGFNDLYKYGLQEDLIPAQTSSDDEGTFYYNFNSNENSGIPKSFKSGFYYSDKLNTKTKLNLNYTFKHLDLHAQRNDHSLYLLKDTTYTTDQETKSSQLNEIHALNLSLTQKIDSLNELIIVSKFNTNPTSQFYSDLTSYKTLKDSLTRNTAIENSSTGKNQSWNNTLTYTKKFLKKNRELRGNFIFNYLDNRSTSTQISINNSFVNSGTTDSTNQKKNTDNIQQTEGLNLTYTEPLNLKTKLELSYDFNYTMNTKHRETLDKVNGEYNSPNPLYSNNFKNIYTVNRLGLKYIFEVKKQKLVLGSFLRNSSTENMDLISGSTLHQPLNSILPLLNYRYKFSDNKTFNFSYKTSATQPDIRQLQPLKDNTNPNQIRVGNPKLVANYAHSFNATFNTFQPLSGKYFFANINFYVQKNGFSNALAYDSIGRSSVQAINVNGNYSGASTIEYSMPFFNKVLNIAPYTGISVNSNTNYINSQKNITKNIIPRGGYYIYGERDKWGYSQGFSISYTMPKTSLSTAHSEAYLSQTYDGSFRYKFPKNFSIESDFSYTINSKRTNGYNIRYFILNGSISKSFLKNENLIVALDAIDLLNQNINVNRTVENNIITDTKTQLIGRYFLFRLTYKINSTKTKDSDHDF